MPYDKSEYMTRNGIKGIKYVIMIWYFFFQSKIFCTNKMSQEIKIIPSNIQKFQQKSNTMLVSTGNAQKGAVQNR